MTFSLSNFLVEPGSAAVPIFAVTADRLDSWAASQSPATKAWLAATAFRADTGTVSVLPDGNGAVSAVVLGLGKGDDPWATGALAKSLPKGVYRIAENLGAMAGFATWAALAWGLGGYSFNRYKSEPAPERARLQWPEGCDRAYVEAAGAELAAAAPFRKDLRPDDDE